MKFRIIYTIFSLGCLALLFMGSSMGRAGAQNWGNTGAPGDQLTNAGSPWTCLNCHGNGIGMSMDVSITDLDGNALLNNEYVPEMQHLVTVTMNHTGMGAAPVGYGFQMLPLLASNDEEIPNALSNPSSNAQIEFAGNTSRTYVEQNDESSSNVFTFQWFAPEPGSGAVNFYGAGVGVNGNNMSSGDGGTTAMITLEEGSGVSNKEIFSNINLNLLTNPVQDYLNINATVKENQTGQISVLTLNGQRVLNEAIAITTGENQLSFNVSALQTGAYLMLFETEKGKRTVRFVKK